MLVDAWDSVWEVADVTGSAAAFHDRVLPDPVVPTLWWFEVTNPALVLGSAQPMAHVDAAACAAAGVEVVRRRSGGGAVLLRPGEVVWLDVILPRSHAAWSDDVGASAWWLGDVWRRAVASLGVDGATVHRSAMQHRAWSRHVCFAGVGGGEVVVGEHKLVGISQRRTRDGARFQCALYRRWSAAEHASLFAEPAPSPADLDGLVATVDASPADIRTAFHAALAATPAAPTPPALTPQH